jgi:hypothetical protein
MKPHCKAFLLANAPIGVTASSTSSLKVANPLLSDESPGLIVQSLASERGLAFFRVNPMAFPAEASSSPTAGLANKTIAAIALNCIDKYFVLQIF